MRRTTTAPPSSPPSLHDRRTESARSAVILYAAIVLFALQVVHALDHAIGHPPDAIGQVPGLFGFITNAAVIYLAWREDALAPLAAAAVGFFSAAALIAIHLAPHWGALSDPYSKLDLPAISWAIVLVSIAWSLFLGVLGLREMLARQSRTAAA